MNKYHRLFFHTKEKNQKKRDKCFHRYLIYLSKEVFCFYANRFSSSENLEIDNKLLYKHY